MRPVRSQASEARLSGHRRLRRLRQTLIRNAMARAPAAGDIGIVAAIPRVTEAFTLDSPQGRFGEPREPAPRTASPRTDAINPMLG